MAPRRQPCSTAGAPRPMIIVGLPSPPANGRHCPVRHGVFMIVWSGLGFLAGVIVLGVLAGVQYATGIWFNDPRYYQTHGWPKMAGLLISAVIVWFVGNYLNRRGERVLVDPKTGE